MASTIPDSAQQPQSNGEVLAKKEEGSPYTLEGLQAHKTRESFWMLLHDKVYDVSKFLDEVSVIRGWLGWVGGMLWTWARGWGGGGVSGETWCCSRRWLGGVDRALLRRRGPWQAALLGKGGDWWSCSAMERSPVELD